ncbi:hypothetical protein OKW96_10300 [Sphingobacterium sp. KU25419]|nr:hypothetical protein OKW96_10300 [Sphingobacterium sp. KU25419]
MISLIYEADKTLSPEETSKLENWIKIQFPENQVNIIEKKQ